VNVEVDAAHPSGPHNLLTSGDGSPALKWGSTNAYTEVLGRPHYDWSIVDGILGAGLILYASYTAAAFP